jgi:hypothetical protein
LKLLLELFLSGIKKAFFLRWGFLKDDLDLEPLGLVIHNVPGPFLGGLNGNLVVAVPVIGGGKG